MEKPKLIEDLGRLYFSETSKQKRKYAIFECPFCGKHFKTQPRYVKDGTTKSCGCYNLMLIKTRSTIHGFAGTRIYTAWKSMIRRCYVADDKRFDNYGRRGITVCEEWRNDFMAFYGWAHENGYRDDLEIDRINNDKGYYPDNCRWVKHIKNSQNTRLIKSTNKSGYRGVHFHVVAKKWEARLCVNYKIHYLGLYTTKEEAAQAYNNFVIENKTSHPLNIISG